MPVEYAFLAKGADVTPDGKFSVLGGELDSFEASNFPYIGSFHLVLKCIFGVNECDRDHALSVEVIGAEGRDPAGNVAVPRLSTTVHPPSILTNPERGIAMVAIFHFQGVVFPRAGDYEIRIILDDQEPKTIALRVKQRS